MLLSAVLHASWNALLSRQADPRANAALFVGGAASLAGVYAIATAGTHIPTAAVPWVVGSGIVEAFYFWLLAESLARLPLGTAYAVSRGGGQLVTWPLAAVVEHEPMDARSGLGALILTGGLWTTIRGGSRAGLPWAIACAVAIGVYPLTYHHALGLGVRGPWLFALSLAIAWPVQVWLLGTTRNARMKTAIQANPWVIVLGSCLCAGSFLLFLAALTMGGAARASALRNTSVFVAAVIAWWLGEPLRREQWIGMALVAIGAVLIAG